MAHFAQIDENNIVVQVLVVEQEFIDTGALGDPSKWIQTSYNTRGGIHEHGKEPVRYHFAATGFIYDPELDIFYAPCPFKGWTYDHMIQTWNAPVEHPDDGKLYSWDNEVLNWVEDPVEL